MRSCHTFESRQCALGGAAVRPRNLLREGVLTQGLDECAIEPEPFLQSRSETPDRDDVDSVLAAAGDASARDHPERRRLAVAIPVDVGAEAEQSGGSTVDIAWVELDLEGRPLVVADRDDGVDFVAVGVTPGVDHPAVWLGEDPKVAATQG